MSYSRRKSRLSRHSLRPCLSKLVKSGERISRVIRRVRDHPAEYHRIFKRLSGALTKVRHGRMRGIADTCHRPPVPTRWRHKVLQTAADDRFLRRVRHKCANQRVKRSERVQEAGLRVAIRLI